MPHKLLAVFLTFALSCMVMGHVYAAAQPETPKAEEKKSEESDAESSHGDSEKGGEGEKAKKPADRYVQLDPIIVPVLQKDGLQQVVSMVVVIEAKDADKADIVRDKKPKLADAFLSDMYGVFSRPENLDNGIVKISELKTRMMELAAKILGPDVVADVLLQVLQQRPA